MSSFIKKSSLLTKGLSEFLKDSKIIPLSIFVKNELDDMVYVRSHFRHRPIRK